MKISNNLGVVVSSLGSAGGGALQTSNIGKVFHVIIDENSVGFTDWSSIGKVYYVDPKSPYPLKDNYNSIEELNTYDSAISLSSSNRSIPVIGELILIINAPSKSPNKPQSYYINHINIYNNTNHNSQVIYNKKEDGTADLGLGIIEKNVSNLFPFEGDNIINGRWGHGIRFSSTLNENNLENFWSITGKNGDPITLLVNGYNPSPELKGKPYVEDINNDKSSLYLTSTQAIPIQIDNNIVNPLFTSQFPEKYYDSQVILSANRILINSNKDEILLYSKTNTSISSKNTTFISAAQNVLINGGQYVFLGLNSNNGKLPTEPVLLGDKTITLLNDLLTNLKTFSSALNNAIDNSSRPLLSISAPASSLEGSMDAIIKQLEGIKSKKVYTI
jgi:hypothetical protein